MRIKRKFVPGSVLLAVFVSLCLGNFTASALTDVAQCKIEGITDKTYTGEKIALSLKITGKDRELKKGRDYKTAYASNINVGTAKVKITGIGDFGGELIKEFNIIPQPPRIVSIYPAPNNEQNLTVVETEKIDDAKDYTLSYRLSGEKQSRTFTSKDNLFKLNLEKEKTYQFIVSVTVNKNGKLLKSGYSDVFTRKIPGNIKYPDKFLGAWTAVTFIDPKSGKEFPVEKVKLKAYYKFGTNNIIHYSYDNGNGIKEFELTPEEYSTKTEDGLFVLQIKDGTGLDIPFVYIQNGHLFDYDGSGVVKFQKDGVS